MNSHPFKKPAPSVRGLIEWHRRLIESKNPFPATDWCTLLAAGALNRHLTRLTDRQIGQLMREEVGRDLGITQPETTICQQPTRCLFRLLNKELRTDDITNKWGQVPGPKCGHEVELHYGINEPDFIQCVRSGCEYKEFVDATGTRKEQE